MNDRLISLDPATGYWAVLDGSLLKSGVGVTRREQLLSLFESRLPRPLAGLHCVFATMNHALRDAGEEDAHRWMTAKPVIAFGYDVDRLQALRSTHPSAVTAAPSAWPDAILRAFDNESLPSLVKLNVLSREFEPHLVRRQRLWTLRWMLAGGLAAAAAFLIGVETRRSAVLSQIDALGRVEADLVAAVLPNAKTTSSANPQPAALQLAIALRSLEQTRSPSVDVGSKEAAPLDELLASLFETWPRAEELRIRSLDLSDTRLQLQATSSDAESLQRLSTALADLPFLTAEPPTIRRSRSEVNGTFSFRVEPTSALPVASQ